LSLAHGPEVLDPFSPPEPLQPTAQLLPLAGWCDPEDRAADHLLGGVAVHALGAAIPARHRPVRLAADDRVVRGLDDRREQRLGLVGLHTLGHVPAHADHPFGLAVRRAEHPAPRLEPAYAAVRPHRPVLGVVWLVAAYGALDGGADASPVFREDPVPEGVVGAGEAAGGEPVDRLHLLGPHHFALAERPLPGPHLTRLEG